MNGYKDLIVWQKSMKLVSEIYILTRKLPKEEIYGIVNQMRRAAVSIPSNIAEGYERNSKKEFVKFLYIAKSSRAELETQIYICLQENYISCEEADKVFKLCLEIKKMISSLIDKYNG